MFPFRFSVLSLFLFLSLSLSLFLFLFLFLFCTNLPHSFLPNSPSFFMSPVPLLSLLPLFLFLYTLPSLLPPTLLYFFLFLLRNSLQHHSASPTHHSLASWCLLLFFTAFIFLHFYLRQLYVFVCTLSSSPFGMFFFFKYF